MMIMVMIMSMVMMTMVIMMITKAMMVITKAMMMITKAMITTMIRNPKNIILGKKHRFPRLFIGPKL